MNCQEYQDLSHVEKITFIGELLHSVQTDSALFKMAQQLIDLAVFKGVFNGVTILPETSQQPENKETA